MLTKDYLRSIIDYNPDTGLFTWKYNPNKPISWNNKFANKTAGGTSNNYIVISIDGSGYLAHRLAFLFMTGSIPTKVDHKDRNTKNNKWLNLRDATTSENAANSNKRITNSSGYKNISWHKSAKKWRVQVRKNGKLQNGGLFESLKDAVEKANELRKELFGEFALQEEYVDN